MKKFHTYFTTLKNKEVVNVRDGSAVGCICDLEIDPENGRICALILPPRSFLASFKKGSAVHIPFGCIRQIGRDLILVELGLPKGCN